MMHDMGVASGEGNLMWNRKHFPYHLMGDYGTNVASSEQILGYFISLF